VTVRALLRGGIIAAGGGSRLRQAGFSMPKPLVPVSGVPLIEAVIRNFVAAGVTSLVIIVKEEGRACVEWVSQRFPHVEIEFIRKTTRSSLESFLEVNRRIGGDRALISTVDSWCPPSAFTTFVEAARRRPAEASVLGVTPLVADETPLWVHVDAHDRVRELGTRPGGLVTAGVYLMSRAARTVAAPPSLGRLREFLAWLVAQHHPIYAETIESVVDVDRVSDIALAEALARSGGKP
jgi:NDP-sugar pyrophosphorylase family protein